MKLNKPAYKFAQELAKNRMFVADEKDAWSEHQPSVREENDFIKNFGLNEYSKWHLGIDESMGPEMKGRYKFPYGDFEKMHRCGVLAAENRAGQYHYHDIESAAAHLHGMIDALASERK
jgi:hypothetical protein